MPEKFEVQEISICRNKINACRIEWKARIPNYQAIADAIAALGVTPTKENVLQAANNKLEDIKKAYENTLTGTVGDIKRAFFERENMPVKSEEIYLNASEEQPHRLKNNAVTSNFYSGDLKDLKNAISKLESFVGFQINQAISSAMNPDYLSVENGKVLISEETFRQIVSEHFTIRAETKSQLAAYEKALQIEELLNDLMQPIWKIDPTAEFSDLFAFDKEGNYQFDQEQLKHF